jgi:hypothetical protein
MESKTKNIAVLFCEPDSIYKTLPGYEVYDKERDALTFPGGMPGVYHPPCRGWCKLRQFAKPESGEKDLAIWSVEMIRTWGGVLEHPAGSALWADAKLPRAGKGEDKFGGFTLSIDQYWFGHKAQKRTLLYVCGVKRSDVPDICFKMGRPTHGVCNSKTGLLELSKKARKETPVRFAEWLCELARNVGKGVK